MSDAPLLLWPGFEAAYLGLVHRCAMPSVACYDYERMVKVLVTRDGMEDEDAREFLDFNYVGGYVGERTPFVLRAAPLDELTEDD